MPVMQSKESHHENHDWHKREKIYENPVILLKKAALRSTCFRGIMAFFMAINNTVLKHFLCTFFPQSRLQVINNDQEIIESDDGKN